MTKKSHAYRRRSSVSASRRIFTHSYLHSAARLALEQGEAHNKGSFFNFMTSIILSAFSLEAYLNHVGALVVPYWIAIERKLGPQEKVDILGHELNLQIDRSREPFKYLNRIIEFRNSLAHGRTTQLKRRWIQFRADGDRIEYPHTKWEKECTSKIARQYLTAVEDMIRHIHEASGQSGPPFGVLDVADYSAMELPDGESS